MALQETTTVPVVVQAVVVGTFGYLQAVYTFWVAPPGSTILMAAMELTARVPVDLAQAVDRLDTIESTKKLRF
jgi:hypothetical protein